MDFYNFAEQHGLIIDHLLLDRWVRCPTTDKPHSKNGAYIYDGQSGAVQNWAVHEKPVSWHDKNKKHDPQLAVRKAKSTIDQATKQRQAAGKAAWILKRCVKQKHDYMAKKGFPDDKVNVWNGMMIIPMRIDNHLTGIQLITEEGRKTFLSGQKNKGSYTVIDAKGKVILCEGVATAMSIRRALKAVKTRYTIVICFSASNILEVSKVYPECVIVADNDTVGIRVAEQSGKIFCVPPTAGEDFNDYEVRVGAKEAGEFLIASIPLGGIE